jgi:hypothetical protein
MRGVVQSFWLRAGLILFIYLGGSLNSWLTAPVAQAGDTKMSETSPQPKPSKDCSATKLKLNANLNEEDTCKISQKPQAKQKPLAPSSSF